MRLSPGDTPEPCEGCGEGTATYGLWLQAPLGLCFVRVHHSPECANAARDRRGGGRFLDGPPLSATERMEREHAAEVAAVMAEREGSE